MLMPTVKWFGGFCSRLSKTAFAIAGAIFESSPYRPPTQTTWTCTSMSDVATSRYSGSPNEPSSFVLSRTPIFLTAFGSAAMKCFALHRGQVDGDETDLLAILQRVVDRLFHDQEVCAHHDDALCVLCRVVLEDFGVPARDLAGMSAFG